MISCQPSEMYPKPDQVIEELIYRDENDFEWRIARVANGFFVKYFGVDYFMDRTFECETSDGQHHSIPNTNCIFINDAEFETFAEVRNVIKIGYTDDIWDTFRGMFEELLECEMQYKLQKRLR